MHRPPLDHSPLPPGEEDGATGWHPLSQTRGLLQRSQVNLCGNDTDIWSHCLSFLKRKQCPAAEMLPQPLAPPFPPSSSVFHLTRSHILTSSLGVFLSLPWLSEKKGAHWDVGGPRLDPVGVVRRSDTVDRLSLLFILLSFLLKTPRSPALSVLMVWLGWQYLPCRIVDVVVVVVVYFRYPLYIWNEDQSM